MGVDPLRARRWFTGHYGMTFHAYHRARRLGAAFSSLRNGQDLTDTAYDSGFESLSGFRDAFSKEFEIPPGRARSKNQVMVRQIYGGTASYSEQAARIGRPECVRAVARANGENRIAILIPCHRVVASDGSLCGYGGGLWRKRYLLALEQGSLGSHGFQKGRRDHL
jgi:O-6-methylguanine DNA methyltransferase